MRGELICCATLLCGLAALGADEAPASPGPLALTQAPHGASAAAAGDRLDRIYGPGSRVVVALPPLSAGKASVLSEGLYAAGGPAASYDGERVYFAGKARADGLWQVYEAGVNGGPARVVTAMPGGAGSPALLPDGSVVFASPVPKEGNSPRSPTPPQLYAQLPGAKPRQLTFGLGGAADPTLLPDGRILFVSALSPGPAGLARGLSLFTINNDGTEITGFACQHDPPALLARPQLLRDGRVAFLTAPLDRAVVEGTAECVRMARPYLSRAKLLPGIGADVSSVGPEGDTDFLVCAANAGAARAVYRLNGSEEKLGAPWFADPRWDCLEAVSARAHPRPMGRISTMDLAKKTGQILCMDVNDTTYREAGSAAGPTTARIRVLAAVSPGACRSLGEVPVQSDGSVMAEIPADLPIGFEALDAQGRVLRRVEPILWVRPGENRSCVGCHAAHNRAPHNHRPLAVYATVPCLSLDPEPAKAKGPQ